MPNIVPAKAEIVAMVRIYAKPQQFALYARTGETTPCVLIVTIGKIPKQIVAMQVNKADELVTHPSMCLCRASDCPCGLFVFTIHNMWYQRIRQSSTRH